MSNSIDINRLEQEEKIFQKKRDKKRKMRKSKKTKTKGKGKKKYVKKNT